jgi:hypothetical protein
MMKLLCIHAKAIKASDGISTKGRGLQEGEIYTCDGIIYEGKSDVGAMCYYILELNELKRCERFLPLSDKDEMRNEISIERKH